MRRILLMSALLLNAGCIGPEFPIYPPGESLENTARVLGLPTPGTRPLTPVAGNAWPAAPIPTPTMLDFLTQEKATASPAQFVRASASAASRGDFGLCQPGPVANGQRSAPPGVALGVC